MRAALLWLLGIYRLYITLLFGYGSCRYYPSCSEYARIHFEISPISTAFYHSFTRILRCNQLFEGGIDYPSVSLKIQKTPLVPNASIEIGQIKYWLYPATKGRFLVIKNFSYKG